LAVSIPVKKGRVTLKLPGDESFLSVSMARTAGFIFAPLVPSRTDGEVKIPVSSGGPGRGEDGGEVVGVLDIVEE
jgi:hypothetical protein